MKVVVVSTSVYRCPPLGYGGAEAFAWYLVKGLNRKGHEVTLIAPPQSKVPENGKLLHIPCSYGEVDLDAEYKAWEWYKNEFIDADYIVDVSLNHIPSEWMWLEYPEHHWKYINVINGTVAFAPRVGPKKFVVGSFSWRERLVKGLSDFADTPWEKVYGRRIAYPAREEDVLDVIYWCVDTDMYAYYEDAGVDKEDFILWFARPTPYKGWKEAIEIAKRNNVKLVLMTGIGNKEHEENFKLLKKEADKNGFDVIVNPTHEQKIEMYQKAKALLYPVQYNECFGLVVVEAMSCGTPVIASTYGAMPELVGYSEAGFTCYKDEHYDEAIESIDIIKPEKCREHVEDWFSIDVCVENYLKLYDRLKKEG